MHGNVPVQGVLVSTTPISSDLYKELLRPDQLRALPPRELLLHAARFPRQEKEVSRHFADLGHRPLQLSVLGSLSTHHLSAMLKLFLYGEGFVPALNVGDFDGIANAALNRDAPFWNVETQALLILPALHDIKSWPSVLSDTAAVDQWVEQTAELYLLLWRTALMRHPEQRIYHAGFVAPYERALGNMEFSVAASRTNCIQRLNNYLLQKCPRNVVWIDLEGLSARVGKRDWFDDTAYFTSKQPLALREQPHVAAYVARLIASNMGIVRKCLVLDLDNTLWGGVIGDEGADGILLDPTDPTGESFLSFQRYVLQLKNRGVLLAVCSKNDAAIAATAFSRNEMLLRLDDFSAFFANWNDKASNLRGIAKELNIGLDTLVFFDDNPAERALVRQFAPQVLVVDVPADPALFTRVLDSTYAFEWPQMTAEDLARSDSFVQERKRNDLQQQFQDYDTYLSSLRMRAWIEKPEAASIDRICQLFNKTNQFNLRTIRYDEESLHTLILGPDSAVIQVRFEDNFSKYGVMSVVVLRFHNKTAFIDNWVMSCRVFNRSLEDAVIGVIAFHAQERGCKYLMGNYIPSMKNGPVANLFERFGFEKISIALLEDIPASHVDGDQGILYRQDLSRFRPLKHHIDVVSTPEFFFE